MCIPSRCQCWNSIFHLCKLLRNLHLICNARLARLDHSLHQQSRQHIPRTGKCHHQHRVQRCHYKNCPMFSLCKVRFHTAYQNTQGGSTCRRTAYPLPKGGLDCCSTLPRFSHCKVLSRTRTHYNRSRNHGTCTVHRQDKACRAHRMDSQEIRMGPSRNYCQSIHLYSQRIHSCSHSAQDVLSCCRRTRQSCQCRH